MLPDSYVESRRLFITLAKSLNAETRNYVLESTVIDGIQLSTDVALLGEKDAKTLLVIASGTHGVEGYAGAACQFRFMQTYLERHARPDLAYLLVHAVNPWGYFHDRRVTQEGVDLNRNFIDFSKPPSSEYGPYHNLLVSDYRPLPGGMLNRMWLLFYLARRGQRRQLQAAVTAGQYNQPDGLFFGGIGPSKSRRVWESIIAHHAPGYERLFLLDIHTGLGKRGHGELISHLPSSSPNFTEVNQWFDGDLRSMSDGASVSSPLEGMITTAFVRTSTAPADAVGLEFGTRAPFAVLNALRADQWTWNHLTVVPMRQRMQARNAMKRAFAPSDATWHQMVMARFDRVIQNLVTGLARR
jgi:hypothetical protein